MAEIIVVNASPLVFLGNAGRLEILRAAGARRVIVPEAVYSEVALGGHVDAASQSLSSAPWIERVGPVAIPTAIISVPANPPSLQPRWERLERRS